ncbi:MAG: hypothetical protein ACRDJ9_36070, partial [Dehalococcoidia bacterium]
SSPDHLKELSRQQLQQGGVLPGELRSEGTSDRIGRPQQWFLVGTIVTPQQLSPDGTVLSSAKQGAIVFDVAVMLTRFDHDLGRAQI